MQRTAIDGAIATFNTALGKVNNMASDADVTAAETALAGIMTAIDAAVDLSTEDLAPYRGTHASSKTALDTLTQARTAYIQDKERQRAAMEAEEERQRAAAEKKDRDDAAKLWVAAINAYQFGTGSEFSTLSSEITDLKVEYKNGSTQITLDNDADVPIRPENSTSPAMGWTAKRFNETDKSRGVIVTNQGSKMGKPLKTSFADYFFSAYDGTPARTTAKNPSPIPGITVGDDEFRPLGDMTFTTTAVLKDSYFGTRPKSLTAGDEQEVTFLGIKGIMTCQSACSVSEVPGSDNEFQLTSAAAFQPHVSRAKLDDLIITIPADMSAKTEYVSFGYWLTTTDDPKKHTIHTFAEGYGYTGDHALIETADVPLLRGSASYSGGAAGVYVLKTGNVDNLDLHDGEFVADVTLKAQFHDPNNKKAVAEEWEITGNINDFRSSTNNDHDLSGWDLKLSADLGTRNAGNVAMPNQVGSPSLTLSKAETMGGGATGAWAATFYGNAGSDTTTIAESAKALGVTEAQITGTEEHADDYPEAVVGQFNGHFVNGDVVGAFGAEKD